MTRPLEYSAGGALRQLRHDGSLRPVGRTDFCRALTPGASFESVEERWHVRPYQSASDNWHLREPLEEAAAQRGLSYEELLIIDPERFQNGKDGPCHEQKYYY